MMKSEMRSLRPTKRDLDAMEARRKEGMEMLAQGIPQSEVARRCKVSTPTAFRWCRAREANGDEAWRRRPVGHPRKIKDSHREELGKILAGRAKAYGFTDDRWTVPRIAAVFERQTGLHIHPGHLWRVLVRQGWGSHKFKKRCEARRGGHISGVVSA